MDFDAPLPVGSFYTAFPDARPAIAPRPTAPPPIISNLPIDGYSLTDHMCTECGSRLIQHAASGDPNTGAGSWVWFWETLGAMNDATITSISSGIAAVETSIASAG